MSQTNGHNEAGPSRPKRERSPDPDTTLASPASTLSDTWLPSDDEGEPNDAASPEKSAKTEGRRAPKPEVVPQIVFHLPEAHDEAVKTYTDVTSNVYRSGKLGRSKGQMDGMQCDCHYDPGTCRAGNTRAGDEADLTIRRQTRSNGAPRSLAERTQAVSIV